MLCSLWSRFNYSSIFLSFFFLWLHLKLSKIIHLASCNLVCFIIKRLNVKFRHKQRLQMTVSTANLPDIIRGIVIVQCNPSIKRSFRNLISKYWPKILIYFVAVVILQFCVIKTCEGKQSNELTKLVLGNSCCFWGGSKQFPAHRFWWVFITILYHLIRCYTFMNLFTF